MAEYQGILICGEVVDGMITTTTRELVTMGSRLCADLRQPLGLLLVGRDIKEAATEAISLGADRAYVVNESSFVESHPDLYAGVLKIACRHITPYIILMGHTDMGRDIAPRLAVKLGAAIATDCVELAIDPDTKLLLQTRPVYGGKAMAVWAAVSDQPQVITMRPRSVMPAESDTSRKGEIISITAEVDESTIKGKLVETVKEQAGSIKLEEATIIVTGGGGIGGSEGFQMLDTLAKVLRGAVGTTRVVSDEGWLPSGLEIGQTGRIVKPTLYIAVGVSGAAQHLAGCLGSKYIVAINKDPNAYIFKVADFGVVGDYREALPPLIEKLQALVAV